MLKNNASQLPNARVQPVPTAKQLDIGIQCAMAFLHVHCVALLIKTINIIWVYKASFGTFFHITAGDNFRLSFDSQIVHLLATDLLHLCRVTFSFFFQEKKPFYGNKTLRNFFTAYYLTQVLDSVMKYMLHWAEINAQLYNFQEMDMLWAFLTLNDFYRKSHISGNSRSKIYR